MTIRMDMIETGSTIKACKMLGTVPVTHEPDEFNLYVRTVGSTVIVSRSDSDETIVSAVGFANAMVKLANFYGLPVVVSHELDLGYAPTKKSQELAGTYEPTREDSGYRTISNGERVTVGSILLVPSLPGTQPMEIVTLGAGRGDAVVRHMVTGDYERVDNVMWYHGEVTATTETVRVVPAVGDRYRNADSGTVYTITEVGEDTFVIGGSLCNTISLTRWVDSGHLVPVVGGAGDAGSEPMPFRTANKRKNTSKSRARRGGAR